MTGTGVAPAGAVRRPTEEQINAFKKFNTTIVSDVLDELGAHGTMLDLKPVIVGTVLVGPAVTVKERRVIPCPTKLRLAEAMDNCKPGDVLVIDAGSDPYAGTWGGLVTLRAQLKQIAGVIVDGAARDISEIREYKFPVWSKFVTPISAVKRMSTLEINTTVQCGEVIVNPGDMIIADDDGACCVPFEMLPEVIKRATMAYEWEQKVLADLKEGMKGLKSDYFKERIV
jgi:regulator of RNase E activity RraA